MPKQKTNSSAKKRFKATGTGAFKRKAQNRRHILTKQSPKVKRQSRGNLLVHDSDHESVARMLVLK
ncbi:MAG: 50S ribosomal protein L35 [Pseudomonadota bacterium]